MTSVATIPLWGRPPSRPAARPAARGRDDSLLAELIDVLLSPPTQAQDRFTDVMHELFDYAQTRNLPGRPGQRGRGAPAGRGMAAAMAGNPAG